MQQLPITNKAFISSLIPQRAPFVMIDGLLHFEENKVTGRLHVEKDNLFLLDGELQEPGLVEHMAQTVAMYTGYQYYLKGQVPPVGYIGSIKALHIHRLPALGEHIITVAEVLHEFMGVTLVNLTSSVNNVVIASAQMKTVLGS